MYASITKIAINKIADTRFHFSLEVGARLKGQASALLKCIFEQLKTGQMPVLSCATTLSAKTLLAVPLLTFLATLLWHLSTCAPLQLMAFQGTHGHKSLPTVALRHQTVIHSHLWEPINIGGKAEYTG